MRRLILYVVAMVALTLLAVTMTACGGGSKATASSTPAASTAMVTTLAGQAGSKGSADGNGAAAHFDNPLGIACDAAGHLYVADYGNDTVRKITFGH